MKTIANRAVEMQETVRDFARRCLLRTKNDVVKARELLLKEIKHNDDMREELLGPALERMAEDLLREIQGAQRTQINRQVRVPGRDNADGLVHIVMRTPLSNGYLGDATAKDLAPEIESRRTQARTELQWARWFELIAGRIGDKKVRDALTPEQVIQLREQAEREVR